MSEKNADQLIPPKRKANNQIVDSKSRDSLKREFAVWTIEQAKKHRDDRETFEDFGKRYHVAPSTLSTWKKDRAFLDIFKESLPDSLLLEAPEVYATIVRKSKLGDPAMTKLMLQQAKLLEAERTETKNLHVVLDASHLPPPPNPLRD